MSTEGKKQNIKVSQCLLSTESVKKEEKKKSVKFRCLKEHYIPYLSDNKMIDTLPEAYKFYCYWRHVAKKTYLIAMT